MAIVAEGKAGGSSLDSFNFLDVSLRERVPNCGCVFQRRSNHGLIALALMFLGQLERFLLRKAKLLLAFFVVASTCSFHESFSDSATPKYLPDFATFNVWPWIV